MARLSKLEGVSEACRHWFRVERYALRPYELGSNISAIIGDYDETIALSRLGLKIREDAPVLLNNLAFGLASQNLLGEAEAALRRLKTEDTVLRLLGIANKGLIAMRRGNHPEGEAMYAAAIRGFDANGNRRLEAVARVYFAREAAMASLPQTPALIAEARKQLKQVNQPIYERLLKEADALVASAAAPPSPTNARRN